MTYIDAGINAQVFNSVWYPHTKYDLPLLGIDFLAFGKKKILCVLDFQPLKQEENYLRKYIEPIMGIKERYKGLSGSMSKRFYDENVFFSKALAFAKFDSPDCIMEQLFPAFKEYLEEYLKMMEKAEPDESKVEENKELQRQYDQYSAERDPAVGLFSTYWGKEWAEEFTYDYLFADAVPPSKTSQEQADAST